jgi:nitrogen fixation/metabolism regulation signal transduction histidine kinase
MVLAMVASAAIILPTVLLSLFYIRRMNDAVNRIVSEDIELMHVGDRISLDFAQARRDERNFLLYRDSTYLTQSRLALVRIIELADRGRELEPASTADFDTIVLLTTRYRGLLDSLLRLPSQEGLRLNIIPSLTRLRQTHERLLSEAAATADSARRDSLMGEAGRLAGGIAVPTIGGRELNDSLLLIQQQVTAHSDTIVARALQRIEEHRRDARRLAAWGQRNIITVLLLTLATLIWLLVVLPRQAVFPIKRMMNALRRAEEGDLDVRVKLAAGDELGQLARQLNRSFARLAEFDERKVERILQLERRFRLLINDISEGVIVVDKTPNILLANPAVEELLGRPAAEAQGRRLRACLPLSFINEPLERVLAGSTAHQECDILPGLPGSAVCIEALRNRAGDIAGALIVISNPRRPEVDPETPTGNPRSAPPDQPAETPAGSNGQSD